MCQSSLLLRRVSSALFRLVLVFSILLNITAHDAVAEEIIGCVKQKVLPVGLGVNAQRELQRAYRDISSLEAEFLQTSYLAALDIFESSSGKVTFAKPAQMRWDYREPETQVFIFSDDTMWFYQEAQNQVLIDRADRVLLSELPLSFLMGLGDVERDFSVREACQREEGIVLDLLPRAGTKQSQVSDAEERGLKGFQLLISPDNYLPIGARIVDFNGNITSVVLRNLVTNKSLDGQRFEASFPRGTDIQDRRKEIQE